MKRRIPAVIAALATAVCGSLVALGPASTSSAAEPGVSPLTLLAPDRVELPSYNHRVYLDIGLHLEATNGTFELWSHRPSYADPIQTTWVSDNGATALPEPIMKSFRGITKFLHVDIVDKAGNVVLHKNIRTCLNGTTERVEPDGAAHSPYPYDCPAHPFTLGSVQGIAPGWATAVSMGYRDYKISPGRYVVHTSINPALAAVLGISDADANATTKLHVVNATYCQRAAGCIRHAGSAQHASGALPTPRGSGPTGRRTDIPTGPVPDLASLPAYGIGVSRNGNYLQFSATVWNGGNSPLVVDGFRRPHEDVMDAYQYFYDSAGNETGYTPVGEMEWDPRPTHMHWHFKDFARYRLLDANQVKVRRSKKEAFCLAATDAVDYTVPGADWQPYNTDLQTACGDYSAVAVQEALASGSGDTYAQFRAGQSFSLKDLPNGTYYISVEANPDHRLVESTTDNNVSLRQVEIGGVPGARTVTVPPVGVIDR